MKLAGKEYARHGEYTVKPGVAYMPIDGTLIPCGTVTVHPDGTEIKLTLNRVPASGVKGWDSTIVFSAPGQRVFRYVSLPGRVTGAPRQFYTVDDEAKTYEHLTIEEALKVGLLNFTRTNGPLKPDYKVI